MVLLEYHSHSFFALRQYQAQAYSSVCAATTEPPVSSAAPLKDSEMHDVDDPAPTPAPPQPDCDTASLSQALQSLTHLRSLTLRDMQGRPQLTDPRRTDTSSASANLVVSALEQLTQLTHLCCHRSFMESPAALATLMTGLCNLRELDVSFTPRRVKQEVVQLGAAFKQMHGLHAVTLQNSLGGSMALPASEMHASCADSLVDGLTSHSDLHTLDLIGALLSFL